MQSHLNVSKEVIHNLHNSKRTNIIGARVLITFNEFTVQKNFIQ